MKFAIQIPIKKIMIFYIVLLCTKTSFAIIDFHTHLMSHTIKESFPWMPDNYILNSEMIIKELDKNGVQKAVLLGSGYVYYSYNKPDRREKVEFENNFNAQEAAKFPDRLIPFCSLPFSEVWVFDEITRCSKELKMKGLKIHLENNDIDLANPMLFENFSQILNKAGELNLIIMVHVKTVTKGSFEGLVQAILSNNARVIIAHSLGEDYKNLSMFRLIDASSEFFKNVYLDTSIILELYQSAPISLRQEVVWYLRSLNADNILFGSDYPVSSMTEAVQVLNQYSNKILGSYGFTDVEIEKILNENGNKLLSSF